MSRLRRRREKEFAHRECFSWPRFAMMHRRPFVLDGPINGECFRA